MPSTFAHYYFGHEVLKNLDVRARNIILGDKKIFDIGLHGPDIFFYYKPFMVNKVLIMGHDMHRENVDGFIERSACHIGHMKDKRAAISYMMGFICHFALDSECHTIVEKWVKISGVSHTEIEMEFDKSLLRSVGINPLEYRFGKHLPTYGVNTDVIDKIYHLKNGVVNHAVRYMKLCLRVFNIKNEFFRKIEFCVLKLAGQYEFVRGMIINRNDNPRCFKSNEILTEKLNNSIPVAVKLINNYLDYIFEDGELSERFFRNFK